VLLPSKTVELKRIQKGSHVTEIPVIKNPNIEVLETYPVQEPYSYIRVSFNNENSEYLYEVIEPEMNREEKDLLALIKDTLQRTLGYEWEKLTSLDKEEYLRESVDSFVQTRGIKVEPITKKKLGYYIIRDFVGHGVIDVMMRDDDIEDISCDGFNIPIFISHRKYESVRSNIIFDNEDCAEQLRGHAVAEER
jgi:flagellar protein FlaI